MYYSMIMTYLGSDIVVLITMYLQSVTIATLYI